MTLPISYHWPEFIHMATPSFEGGQDMESYSEWPCAKLKNQGSALQKGKQLLGIILGCTTGLYQFTVLSTGYESYIFSIDVFLKILYRLTFIFVNLIDVHSFKKNFFTSISYSQSLPPHRQPIESIRYISLFILCIMDIFQYISIFNFLIYKILHHMSFCTKHCVFKVHSCCHCALFDCF